MLVVTAIGVSSHCEGIEGSALNLFVMVLFKL